MTEPVIRGYRGEVRDVKALVERVRGKPIQLFRADRIYGADHLRHAAALAQRAIDEGRARSLDLATETLVYAAGERQVHKALALLGLNVVTRAIAVVAWDAAESATAEAPQRGAVADKPRPGRVDGAAALDALAAELGWTRDDALLQGDASVLDAFGVTSEERAMLPRERWGDLVLERVALSDVLKA